MAAAQQPVLLVACQEYSENVAMRETNVSCVSGGQQPIAFSTQRLMVSCALNANVKKSLRLDMLQPAATCKPRCTGTDNGDER
jgi:hypothetical protein